MVGLAIDLIVVECCDTDGLVIWPLKSSQKWPLVCRMGR